MFSVFTFIKVLDVVFKSRCLVERFENCVAL